MASFHMVNIVTQYNKINLPGRDMVGREAFRNKMLSTERFFYSFVDNNGSFAYKKQG